MRSLTTARTAATLILAILSAGLLRGQTPVNPELEQMKSEIKAQLKAELMAELKNELAPNAAAAASPAAAVQPEPAADDPRYPVDLLTVLRLAGANSRQIELAAARMDEADAIVAVEDSRLWPTIRFGASYQAQDGLLQETNGQPRDVERSSQYLGMGAGAGGAGAPTQPGVSLRLDLADVVYRRLAARQLAEAAVADRQTAEHLTLYRAAGLYDELQHAKEGVELAKALHRDAGELVATTAKFSAAGAGLQADAERAAVQELIAETAIAAAERRMQQVSAELAQLLRLEPGTQLEPLEKLTARALVDATTPLPELLTEALEQRPELAASLARIEAGESDLKRERARRLWPKLGADASFGSFGAGSSATSIDDRDYARTDVAIMLYWELEGLGRTSTARSAAASARIEQARIEQDALREDIARQVSVARSASQSLTGQIRIAQDALLHAEKSVNLNRERIRQHVGLPIEMLQAIQALASARTLLADSVHAYNVAQLQLHTALGRFERPGATTGGATAP